MSTTFQDIQRVGNGAQFHTADLHIHSYGGSPDVKDPAMTIEAIVDTAVRQGFSIIAITDHNTDRQTEHSIDYAQKYAGQLLVLAGVEVTTANGHLLAYFPPANPAALRTFLARLSIAHADTSDSHTAMAMASVIDEAERLGGVCIAAHVDRVKTGFEVGADRPKSRGDSEVRQ